MLMSLTFMNAAGAIQADDNKLLYIQGLDKQQAVAIAKWLAVATSGSVELRHISPMEGGDWIIVKRPEDIEWDRAEDAIFCSDD